MPVDQTRSDSDHIFLELLKEQGAKLDRIADELRAHTQSEAQRMLRSSAMAKKLAPHQHRDSGRLTRNLTRL